MVRGLGRLDFLKRRSTASDPSAVDELPRPPADPDAAPIGPPVLVPAVIYRQVLFTATEFTPAWARRPTPEAVAAPAEPQEATPRRKSQATGTTTAKATKATTPRRPRRPTAKPTRDS